MAQKLPKVLSIAGSDGSGGAGIQADLKTFSALGCYGMTVLTALTVQNTLGVKQVYEIPEKCVGEQLEAILEDIGTDSIKIGMLHRPEVIDAIVEVLRRFPARPIVVDPVMVSKSGTVLLSQEAQMRMREKLLPLTTLLTPNVPEASALLQRVISTKEQMQQAAIDLFQWGVGAVLIKGGHLEGVMAEDLLCLGKDQFYWFSDRKIESKNTHGTGCTLSSAIAAYVAKGLSLQESVQKAKSYVTACIARSVDISVGHGHGPLIHTC